MKSSSIFKVILLFTGCFFLCEAFSETAINEKNIRELCHENSNENTKINESKYVQIGNIEQWVTIKGSSCKNPVVLIVHGGPGNPLSLYSDSLYKGWEDEFTLVHWDQRGSGKTFEANQEVGELTIEKLNQTELDIDLLVQDGVALTTYLQARLGKEKIIISGTSWGSFLAIKMIHSRPNLYHFYVGLSQLVNYSENTLKSFELVSTLAGKYKDLRSIEVLNSMGPPPWESPRSFGKLRRIIKEYEGRVADEGPKLEIASEYLSKKTRAAYTSGEDFSFVKYVGMRGNGMAQRVQLDKCCTKLKIPIYIIQGDEDLLTVPEVTKKFFDNIHSPQKKYIRAKRSGHDPNYRMLDIQLETLRLGVSEIRKIASSK